MFIDVISIVAFVVIVLVIIALGSFLFGGASREDQLRSRLEREALGEDPFKQVSHKRSNKNSDDSAPIITQLASLRTTKDEPASELDKDLRRAGHYSPNARSEFQLARIGLAILGLLGTGGLLFLTDPSQRTATQAIFITGAVATVVAYAFPRVLLSFQAHNRLKRIQSGLPDALDMISMCITGGLSLPLALERVSREIYMAHPDLAVELEIVRQQAELGSLEHSVRQFAERIDLPEVRALSAMINQGQRFGTNVVASLQEFADSERRTSRIRADEKANKASFAMLFPLIFCMAPAVIMLLLGPAVLEIRTFINTQTVEGGVLDQNIQGADASPGLPE